MKSTPFFPFPALLAAAAILAAGCGRAQPDAALLTLEKEIALPGVEARIDHFSADVLGMRLFVAALGNGTVEALDLVKGQHTAQIRGLEEPQGLYFDATTNRLYVASGGNGTLRAYDGTTLTPQKQVALGEDADNVRGDPQHAGQIWVGYSSGGLAILTASGTPPPLGGNCDIRKYHLLGITPNTTMLSNPPSLRNAKWGRLVRSRRPASGRWRSRDESRWRSPQSPPASAFQRSAERSWRCSQRLPSTSGQSWSDGHSSRSP